MTTANVRYHDYRAARQRGRSVIRAQWSEVKGAWHDENTRRFEQTYIAPLLTRLRTVELTMGHMASVLEKVRHDCE